MQGMEENNLCRTIEIDQNYLIFLSLICLGACVQVQYGNYEKATQFA